jgi:hypothetical protein
MEDITCREALDSGRFIFWAYAESPAALLNSFFASYWLNMIFHSILWGQGFLPTSLQVTPDSVTGPCNTNAETPAALIKSNVVQRIPFTYISCHICGNDSESNASLTQVV